MTRVDGTQTRTVKAAVVGAGKMGQHHALALQRMGLLVAVVDVDEASLASFAQRLPNIPACSTIAEACEQHGATLAHICVPPALHKNLALQALAADCDVYVEKPFADSLVATQEILSAAQDAGRKVCAGHQLLFEAPALKLAELLPATGEPVHIESYFSFRPVRRSADGKAPQRADDQLLDVLPHPTYLLLHFLELAVPEGDTRLVSVSVSPLGEVRAIVRRGELDGVLILTLRGRPVENYLRIVGTGGSVMADFVRGTTQHLIGPGISGIDKVAAPFRTANQIEIGTVLALLRRVWRRGAGYPGLEEIFGAFVQSIRQDGAPPVSEATITGTMTLWDEVRVALESSINEALSVPLRTDGSPIAVTGGTGFLGCEVVRSLLEQGPVRVLARREPAPWERIPGVEYRVADLSQPLAEGLLADCTAVVHCAAETSGGFSEHERNSIQPVQHLMAAAAQAKVPRFVHISSIAVVDASSGMLGENQPLVADARSKGPYVWGKAESERQARALSDELGIELSIVRPGAIVDARAQEIPGRLGRIVGNILVVIGGKAERLPTVDVRFAGRVLAQMARSQVSLPAVLHLLDHELPTRAALVDRAKRHNPTLFVVRLPWLLVHPLALIARGLMKLRSPGSPAMDIAAAFSAPRLDNQGIREYVRAHPELGEEET